MICNFLSNASSCSSILRSTYLKQRILCVIYHRGVMNIIINHVILHYDTILLIAAIPLSRRDPRRKELFLGKWYIHGGYAPFTFEYFSFPKYILIICINIRDTDGTARYEHKCSRESIMILKSMWLLPT